MSERIIIGESERAGWPISAPAVADVDLPSHSQIRWVQRKDNTYALEFFGLAGWAEVPCVVLPQPKQSRSRFNRGGTHPLDPSP